jgi:soluble cytochrome b562
MKRINDFIGKSNVGEKSSEMERVMKENMTVLKKQIDKQKMKIISLNSKMKSLNKMEHMPARKIVKRSVATTQTIENFYNEDQLMTIYKKLNESKENGRLIKEKNKQLEVEKEIIQNELENLTVLKNKYQEESLDKTKIISDLQGVQAHLLELEKNLNKVKIEKETANSKLKDMQEEYDIALKKIDELKDLNETMHKTIMSENNDIDDSCNLLSNII